MILCKGSIASWLIECESYFNFMQRFFCTPNVPLVGFQENPNHSTRIKWKVMPKFLVSVETHPLFPYRHKVVVPLHNHAQITQCYFTRKASLNPNSFYNHFYILLLYARWIMGCCYFLYSRLHSVTCFYFCNKQLGFNHMILLKK